MDPVDLSPSQEMNTDEHFNTSVDVTITVLDGDDQYPQFQPCVLLFQDESSRVCTSPMYTVNITEGEEVSKHKHLKLGLPSVECNTGTTRFVFNPLLSKI